MVFGTPQQEHRLAGAADRVVDLHAVDRGLAVREPDSGEVRRQMEQVASDVRSAVIPASGHNIALENPAALAQAYLDFFAGR
jgi:pimeloyl-ACP methyl ester carboxylesterase